jgi:hypothetical protein
MPTTTITHTFTPPPRTICGLDIIYSTTQLSCLPSNPYHYPRARSPHADMLEARQNAVYETPNCGLVTTTTTTKPPAVSVVTSTSTDTETDITSTTTTISVIAALQTAYSDVAGTTTVTPSVLTRTKFTKAPRQMVTDVNTVTIIETLLPPGGIHAPRCLKKRVGISELGNMKECKDWQQRKCRARDEDI